MAVDGSPWPTLADIELFIARPTDSSVMVETASIVRPGGTLASQAGLSEEE
jgi:hypothetical protein